MKDRWYSPNHCPVMERTGDGVPVGRCWFYLDGDVCPRHGNVADRETAQAREDARTRQR